MPAAWISLPGIRFLVSRAHRTVSSACFCTLTVFPPPGAAPTRLTCPDPMAEACTTTRSKLGKINRCGGEPAGGGCWASVPILVAVVNLHHAHVLDPLGLLSARRRLSAQPGLHGRPVLRWH